ncbi:RidA family protein [Streptomyces milbemycinicus]|uniref:RidA family protein n=1 Tax=Streptomyces milbemycinicus TaxID=476552 RepID=UPI00340D16FA
MAIAFVNPSGLPKIDVYRQVSIASGSRLVFIAGQVAWDAAGVTIGEGDLAAQVEQSYLNVGTALAEALRTRTSGCPVVAMVGAGEAVCDPRDKIPWSRVGPGPVRRYHRAGNATRPMIRSLVFVV